MKLTNAKQYLLLVDEGAEIKEGCHFFGRALPDEPFGTVTSKYGDHFALTDLEGNKHGLSSEQGDKAIAYYPLSKGAKGIDLPLLPNPFGRDCGVAQSYKQFSLEDVKKAIGMARIMKDDFSEEFDTESMSGLAEICTYGLEDKYTEEEIIQSLIVQQLPKEFIPEYEYVHDDSVSFPKTKTGTATLKIITNSEGKRELVGTYMY